jgi:hypothetical protein
VEFGILAKIREGMESRLQPVNLQATRPIQMNPQSPSPKIALPQLCAGETESHFSFTWMKICNDYDLFNALSTALMDARSMFVSTAAPQRNLPSACLIWIYAIALASSPAPSACSL